MKNNFIIFKDQGKALQKRVDDELEKRRKKQKDLEIPPPEFQVHALMQQGLDNHCNIRLPRTITSHRKIVGPALIQIRKLLYDEIRRSVDPSLERQTEINKDLVIRIERLERLFEETKIRTEHQERLLQENMKQTNANIKEIFKHRELLKLLMEKK